LQRAAVHNWPCPAALDEDELDLPGYQPTARWRYAAGTGIAADDPLGKTRPTQGDRRARGQRAPAANLAGHKRTSVTREKNG
jgi:hypothetical protein